MGALEGCSLSKTSIETDDYARLHDAYHEDTDLDIIADQLEQEFAEEGAHLVWLYWPRMIAAAKAAKTFGWFATTPRKLAQSVRDVRCVSRWEVRERMWELLADRDLVRVRQGRVVSASSKIDVLMVEWEKWQAMSSRERQRLKRHTEAVEQGEIAHWTVRHLARFAFSPVTDSGLYVTADELDVTLNAISVTPNGGLVTTQDKTRQDETREEKRDTSVLALPKHDPSVVREIFAHWQAATGRPGARLGKDRAAKIAARLREGYTPEQIKDAISGYAASKFHRGENDQGTRYDTLELICRNGEKLERGIEMRGGKPGTPVSVGGGRHNVSREYDDGIQWHNNDEGGSDE